MNFFKNLINRNSIKTVENTLSTNIKSSIAVPVENIFQKKSQNNMTMLRTIIDDDLAYEDLFKHITTTANSTLPAPNEDKITLFIPLDEVLLFSFIPDENVGMFDMPKLKDYDVRIELTEYKTFAFIYYRDYLEEFLNYIDEHFEPVLYTTGEKFYVDKIMSVIDPNNIFKYKLYQEDCHLYKNIKSNNVEFLKDVNLFYNRSLKKKILIDYANLNYILSPDNCK